jgi:hypothetical protein
MPKILYLNKDATEAFNFKRALKKYRFEILDEMTPGGVMARLQEKVADILVINDNILGRKTVDLVKTIRDKVPWFLQIPIVIIAENDIGEQNVADFYKAGANFVYLDIAPRIEEFVNFITSMDKFVKALKVNNPYVMGKL